MQGVWRVIMDTPEFTEWSANALDHLAMHVYGESEHPAFINEAACISQIALLKDIEKAVVFWRFSCGLTLVDTGSRIIGPRSGGPVDRSSVSMIESIAVRRLRKLLRRFVLFQ
jgi:hypothetical protein